MATPTKPQKRLVLRRVRESDNFVVFECQDVFTRVRRNGTSEPAPMVAGKNIHIAKAFAEAAERLTITLE